MLGAEGRGRKLINSAPDDIRPKVFVSATAVGYYGMFVCQNWLNTNWSFACMVINIIMGCLMHWFNHFWSTFYNHWLFNNYALFCIKSKFFHFAATLLCSGTSETQVFDEQSPSGKDYLAEVRKKIHVFHIFTKKYMIFNQMRL